MDLALKKKISDVFCDLAVDKKDALQAGFETLPRFVTEFLLAKAKAKNQTLSLIEIRERINKHSIDAARKREFISRLMRDKSAALMALFDVEPKPHLNVHVGHISQLDGFDLVVDEELAEEWPELLYGGIWGSIALRYDADSVPSPTISVEEFEPLQLTKPDVNRFREARRHFTLDEWVELLVTSAGYRPAAFPTFRHRLLVLSRLVPLVQKNVHMIELGPPGTGKSYLLRNLSSSVYLLAGAKATPAMLLYNIVKKTLGIVGTKKVIVFDEIGNPSFA